MLTSAMGLEINLLLLDHHSSYPEGRAIHVRAVTGMTPHLRGSYHVLNIC